MREKVRSKKYFFVLMNCDSIALPVPSSLVSAGEPECTKMVIHVGLSVAAALSAISSLYVPCFSCLPIWQSHTPGTEEDVISEVRFSSTRPVWRSTRTSHTSFARTVLSSWSCPPPPPQPHKIGTITCSPSSRSSFEGYMIGFCPCHCQVRAKKCEPPPPAP